MASPGDDGPEYSALRAAMVAQQIAARGVREPRILRAFAEVPRHLFVPEAYRPHAYEDRPLPIGEGQTISQPYMVAVMTEVLGPGAGDRMLEIGTGSGYQAAILARLVREVVSLERHPTLADRARSMLAELGVTNVQVIVGDGSSGYEPLQPYDGIIVTAGAREVPAALREQLAVGGRLVIPIGEPVYQVLTLVRRLDTGFVEEAREGCVFVPLVGPYGW